MAGRVSGDGCCSLVVGVWGWVGAFEIWGGGGWKFQRGMEMEGLSAFFGVVGVVGDGGGSWCLGECFFWRWSW